MKNLISFLLVSLLVFGMSCGEDPNACNRVFFGGSSIFNEEVADVNEAAVKYSEEPTTENCNEYREKVQVYLDRLLDFRDCVPDTDIDRFDADIKGIEDQLAQIEC